MYLGNSHNTELYGRIHADMFNSDKMLINGVEMNIKLTRAPEAFYLLRLTDDTKVRKKISDATFYYPIRIKAPSRANVLAMKRKAIYPVTF
jgi:hypothetical protein